jgi:SAM-dependent methyltransferase
MIGFIPLLAIWSFSGIHESFPKQKQKMQLPPSKLGTKEYWNHLYTQEIKNFQDFGDKGEVWFGEQARMEMVEYCQSLPSETTFIDVGCGNGHLLFDLYDLGYRHLIGLDYAPESIALCQEIAKQEEKSIVFETGDLLEPLHHRVNVVLDKGTYDAISLSAQDNACEQYRKNVHEMLHPEGLLIITSCNWTRQELMDQFQTTFEYVEHIPYPTFRFGGVEGQTISTVIFKKV